MWRVVKPSSIALDERNDRHDTTQPQGENTDISSIWKRVLGFMARQILLVRILLELMSFFLL